MGFGTNLIRPTLMALVLSAWAGTISAQGVTEKEIKGVDGRYAIASEHFGDGQVQVKTRSGSGEQNSYEIYSFSCADETFELLFAGDELSSDFRTENYTHTGTKFDPQSETAYIAAHACEEHGYPLLGFEW